MGATLAEVQHGFNHTGALYEELQIEEADHKAQPPAQIVEILGFEIDTVAMEIRVPAAKVSELIELCDLFCSRKSAGLREVQLFVGKLTWAARVVQGGQVFLSCLFQLFYLEGPARKTVHLTKEFQADVAWWHHFLKT